MTRVLKVNINDINSQFFIDLGEKLASSTEIEIRSPDTQAQKELFTDEQFWQIIEAFDWSKKEAEAIMAPAVDQLAAMPVMNIYLFADKLSEKLFQLDTRAHGDAYLANEGDDYLSVDDFLYIRCAVVAEGSCCGWSWSVCPFPGCIKKLSRYAISLHVPKVASLHNGVSKGKKFCI